MSGSRHMFAVFYFTGGSGNDPAAAFFIFQPCFVHTTKRRMQGYNNQMKGKAEIFLPFPSKGEILSNGPKKRDHV
ncbi:UNVERIFIED_ORG: hypothetical protein ABRZ91_002048 [Heyndrickxia coagulans]